MADQVRELVQVHVTRGDPGDLTHDLIAVVKAPVIGLERHRVLVSAGDLSDACRVMRNKLIRDTTGLHLLDAMTAPHKTP